MNISTVLGKKGEQSQAFLEDGKRIPLTRVWVGDNSITQVKNTEKDGYISVQVALGEKNKISKPLTGHLKKAGLNKKPRFLREIKVDEVEGLEPGQEIKASEVLKAGDIIDVVGTSKGKGFAGVVKRWGFHGGPKTHGQSDRHRAPGSIGQSATPARVHKGKKMAGRMGNDRVTIKNLEIVEVNENEVVIKGLVPGVIGSLLMITKIGENKNFKPLYSTKDETIGEAVEEVEAPTEEVKEEVKAEVNEEKASENDAPTETSPEESVEEKKAEAELDSEEVKDENKEEPAVEEKKEEK